MRLKGSMTLARTFAVVVLCIVASTFATMHARAETCEDKGVAAAQACKTDPKTPNSLRVQMRMTLSKEDQGTAVDNVCIAKGQSIKAQCEQGTGGDRTSLRDKLKKALKSGEIQIARDNPEPAVSGCPSNSLYCYKVFMGGAKCEVRRRDGKELETDPELPVIYDGMTRSVSVGAEKCPLEYLCVFYQTYGSGSYPGCPKPEVQEQPRQAEATPAPKPEAAIPASQPLMLDPDIEIMLGLPPTAPPGGNAQGTNAPRKGSAPPAGQSPKGPSTITGIVEDRAKQQDVGPVTATPPERKIDPPPGFGYGRANASIDPYGPAPAFGIVRDSATGKIMDVTRFEAQPSGGSNEASSGQPSTITSSYEQVTENSIQQTVGRYGFVPGGLLLEGMSDHFNRAKVVRYLDKANVFILDDEVVYPNPVQKDAFISILTAIKNDDRLGVSLALFEKRAVFGKLPETSKVAMDLFVADGFLADIAYGYKRYTSGYRHPPTFDRSEVYFGNASVYVKFSDYSFAMSKAGVVRRVGVAARFTYVPVLPNSMGSGTAMPDISRIRKGDLNSEAVERMRQLNANFGYYAGERIWRMAIAYGEAAAFARMLKARGIPVQSLQ